MVIRINERTSIARRSDGSYELPDESQCALGMRSLTEFFENYRATVSLIREEAAGLHGGLNRMLSKKLGYANEFLPGIVFSIPMNVIHDMIASIHLPNRDSFVLSRLRGKLEEGLDERGRRVDQRRREKLQWCRVTLTSDLLTVCNRVDGIECEVFAPVSVDGIPAEAKPVAFEVPFYVLDMLFDRTRGVPRLVGWGQEVQPDRPIYFHYNASRSLIEIVYDNAKLRLDVRPLEVAERSLTSLAANGPTQMLDCPVLAVALQWLHSLELSAASVVLKNGMLAANVEAGLAMSEDERLTAHDIVIGDALVKPLGHTLIRMGGNAEISLHDHHYFLRNGVATLSFAKESPDMIDPAELVQAIRKNGFCFAAKSDELLPSVGFMQALEGGDVHLEVLRGSHPHLRMICQGEHEGELFEGVTYVPIEINSNNTDTDTDTGALCFAVTPCDWKKLIGLAENKRVEVLVSAERDMVMIRYSNGENRIIGIFRCRKMASATREMDKVIVIEGDSAIEDVAKSGDDVVEMIVSSMADG
ncbi:MULTISPECIES: hypothetical protein [unclassified Sphingomonas]|uniref:hypothetical protein n=1 Tax=unclassified Sphingomonas TaxID=196159 RepID=UPI000AA4D9E7|nr:MULTISPECIES: hypothetical protein [unclassified Sphingomonas]